MPKNGSSNHQPDLFTSCSLLTLTQIPGRKVKKNINKENDPDVFSPKKILSSLKEIYAKKNSNKRQYQYSARLALPLSTVYFLKQILIAWKKFI
tara:strand:+ start:1334 stop:1615 length:282 start_codon:yes stop_codon:yes gene_type:complete